MELQGHNFQLIDKDIKEQYYDPTLAMLRAEVVGRESEPNMALLGNNTVNTFRIFEDEKYNTFFAEMHVLNKLGNCYGFIEKSDAVKSKFVDNSLKEWESSESELGEIIAMIFKEDYKGVIRAKQELGVDKSLELLSACMVTSLLWSGVCDTSFNTELVCGLYYETDEFLEQIKELKLT